MIHCAHNRPKAREPSDHCSATVNQNKLFHSVSCFTHVCHSCRKLTPYKTAKKSWTWVENNKAEGLLCLLLWFSSMWRCDPKNEICMSKWMCLFTLRHEDIPSKKWSKGQNLLIQMVSCTLPPKNTPLTSSPYWCFSLKVLSFPPY